MGPIYGLMYAGKSFAIGIAADPHYNFFEDTGSGEELYKILRAEYFALVLGHQQSGKTTTAIEAVRIGRLNGCHITYVSLAGLTVCHLKLCIWDIHMG